MEGIPWRSSYETGVAVMDEQHRQLIAIINRLYRVIRDKQGVDELQALFDEMTAYATNHLDEEERLLAEYRYPHLENHRNQHKEYIARVDQLRDTLGSADEQLAIEVYTYLRQWWLQHIMVEDKAYGPHLNQHGVQ